MMTCEQTQQDLFSRPCQVDDAGPSLMMTCDNI